MDLFAQATRAKFRFTSIIGELDVEQLWDLPLTSKRGVDLDTIAKAVNAQVKAAAEESFVETSHNPAKAVNEARLEVVKAIIAVKVAEANKRALDASLVAKRQRLLEILAKKQDAALEGKTEAEILAELEALG